MAINAQFPDWLQQQTRDSQAAGIAIGRNLLEGLRLQEDQRQFNSLAPARAAQVAAQQAQTRAQNNQATLGALMLDEKQKQIGGMADFMAFSATLAENGYTPQNRALLYRYLERFPHMANTPQAKEQKDLFDAAEHFANEASVIESKAQTAIDVANIRADAYGEVAEIRAKSSEEVQKLRSEFLEKQNSGKETLDVREARDRIRIRKNAGEVMTPEFEASELSRLVNQGGKERELAPKAINDLVGGAAVLELVDDTVSGIDAFNTQFGENAFDKYIGRFDKPLDEVLDIIRTRKGAQDVRAYEILNDYSGVLNRTLKTRSGAAVTESEAKRVLTEVGNRASRQFVISLRNFRKNERNFLSRTLEGYKDYGNVPDYVRKVASGSGIGTNQNGSTGSSDVIEFDVLPDGTVKRR